MSDKNWTTTDKCLNCGSPVTGNYCSNCGQETNTGRYGVSTISKDLAKEKFNIKSKHLKTLLQLIISPGKFSREFLSGKRVSYTKPIAFYLFILGIYLVLFHNFSDVILPPDNTDVKHNELNNIVKQNMNYFSFIMPAVYSLTFYLFNGKRTGINIAESFVISLYFFAATLVIGILFMLLIFIDPLLWSLRTIIIALYLLYSYYQLAQLKGIKGILLTIITTSSGFFIVVVIILAFSIIFVY